MRCRSCGSTILNTMQQVFGAIGMSIATCLLSMGSGDTDAEGFVAGSRYGYVFGLVLIVIVLVFSFFLKEDKISEKVNRMTYCKKRLPKSYFQTIGRRFSFMKSDFTSKTDIPKTTFRNF